MFNEIAAGVAIPFLGTTLGAAMVFFLKENLSLRVKKILLGFAAGVMTAACFWSLLQPSIVASARWGRLAFIPAAVGFLLGVFFLLFLDDVTPHRHMNREDEGPRSKLKNTTKLVLAVTLHNIPEGMAVGVVFAAWLADGANVNKSEAFALALGIALQNFPEGAIVSMPLRTEGLSKARSFQMGFLSGVVEPIAAILTIVAAKIITPALPYFLAFAAGAMTFVVVEDLIPEMSEGKHANTGAIAFAFGFVMMMILDVALG